MNPSDWIKAATLVTQHKQEAAMAETDQLSSMPLSQIPMDDSGPPVVQYGTHMPIAALQVQMHMCTAHSRKILINRLSLVSLRVHYTLLYHHLVKKQELQMMRYNHFMIKCQKA